jgi:hypothetical protein
VGNIRNIKVKRKYSSSHKTMVEATKRGSKKLIKTMECIHV